MSDQSTAFEVCRQWVALATGQTVIYVRQTDSDVARPQKPYLTVEWPTDQPIGGTPYEVTEEAIDPDPGAYDHYQRRYERRQGVFRVEAFGAGAVATLGLLRPSLRRVTEGALLRDGGVAVRVISDVIDTSERLDTTWEESAIVDFAVLYVLADESPVAIVETADATITVSDKGGGNPLDIEISASLA
jgi:hypothetical protein